MDDQPTRATTAATADMFDLIEADLLRILRSRARLGDLRPRAPRLARQPENQDLLPERALVPPPLTAGSRSALAGTSGGAPPARAGRD